jgi:atypical dual specificity phosphatase
VQVLEALAAPADLWLLDEPTAGLDDERREVVLAAIREAATRGVVVVATHNREDALAVGGSTALLAGGTVHEQAATEEFFSSPCTPAGRRYVATGGTDLGDPAPAPDYPGLWWVVPGALGGMGRPGLTAEVTGLLEVLVGAGVALVVCLEERVSYEVRAFRDRGIAVQHFPIPDMAAPRVDLAIDLARQVEATLAAGGAVVLHCRGGLGRTGCCLAAVLVWLGDPPEVAIGRVRRSQHLAISTAAQLAFVHQFHDRVGTWRPSA